VLPLRTIGQLPLQVEQLIVEVDLHPHVARNRLGPIAGFERKVDSEHADIDAVLNMAPTDQEIEIVPPAEPVEMPLPSDPKVIFLGGLFVLALLASASRGRGELIRASALLAFSPPDTWLKKPFGPGSIVGATKLAMEEVSSQDRPIATAGRVHTCGNARDRRPRV
jgi:hypothetical protein